MPQSVELVEPVVDTLAALDIEAAAPESAVPPAKVGQASEGD